MSVAVEVATDLTSALDSAAANASTTSFGCTQKRWEPMPYVMARQEQLLSPLRIPLRNLSATSMGVLLKHSRLCGVRPDTIRESNEKYSVYICAATTDVHIPFNYNRKTSNGKMAVM